MAAIDQGTTSTRAMIFDHGGRVVAVDQREHRQIFPRAGTDDIRSNWAEGKRWLPAMDADRREREFAQWKKAVTRTFDWVD